MTPSDEAALCVLVLPVLHRVGLGRDISGKEAVARLGVARSFAYERAAKVAALLEEGLDAPRPGPDPDAAQLRRLRVRAAVLEFRVAHPGCWVEGGRTVYSTELRRFVLDLAGQHGVGRDLEQAEFAAACGLPLPTLKDWWASASAPATPTVPPPPASTALPCAEAARSAETTPSAGADAVRFSLEMTRIFHEWDQWHGSFGGFVEHLRELGLHHGKQWVRGVLYLAAASRLLRRPPPKPAGRGSTFRPLPGLQWTSDGKQFDVVVDGRTFRITWQPMTDVGSTATVGSTVRPEEDTAGVVASFVEGVRTTGAPPAALLLDNKACNDSQALHEALPEETFVMHATRGRPQNKAVIEGKFGLFAQELGPLIAVVDTSTAEKAAISVGEAVVRAYVQGRNHRPRRGGKSAYELYRDADHAPDIVAAHIEKLKAIKKHVDERDAREAARRDPRLAAALEDAVARFGFTADGDVLASLYKLSLEAVQTAIAIFAAKHDAASLPADAGLRYFAGIARNCQREREQRFFEEHLVRDLANSGDLVLSYLERKAALLDGLDLAERLLAIVRELLTVPDPIAQVFWRQRLHRAASSAPLALRPALRRFLCERIRRHFAAPKTHCRQLIDLVVRELATETAEVAGA
jgi:hypothetical protein